MDAELANTETSEEHPEELATAVSEWLSFKVHQQAYAVDILRVLEIRIWENATRIPQSANYVTGLINLRGAIVPVVDLRARFGLELKAPDSETVILIVEVEAEQGPKIMGITVDSILEVIESNKDNSQLEPGFDIAIDKSFVAGLADNNQQMVVLLDIDRLLDIDVAF